MEQLLLPALLRDLGLNLGAATILIYGIYFRRHGRRDLVLGYFAFNLRLFVVAASLGSAGSMNIGVGFGLFAVLSIVRLRSDEATQTEIGYTMVSLVMGLLNGLPGLAFEVKVLFTVLLVASIYVIDHQAVLPAERHVRFKVNLDVVCTDHDELRLELERRLGGQVKQVFVQEVDYIRETMRVDVRLRAGTSQAARDTGRLRA